MESLSKHKRQELKIAFDAFDVKRTGALTASQMGRLLRTIGVTMTRRDTKALNDEARLRGPFSFQDLLNTAETVYSNEAIVEGLFTALKAKEMDPSGQGLVPVNKLRERLWRLGGTAAIIRFRCYVHA